MAAAIIRALAPGSGRSNLCDSEDELIERLDQAVVIYDPADVPAALSLLEAGELRGPVLSTPPSAATEAAVRIRYSRARPRSFKN